VVKFALVLARLETPLFLKLTGPALLLVVEACAVKP